MTVQTFIITTVPNPAGAGNIYQVDGQNTPILNLVRGGVYTFSQSDASNANHPIAFKDGSGAAYTVGVVTTGTPGQAGAQTVFTVAVNAPDDLRYYCTTHGDGMGNTISVTTAFSGLGPIQTINTGIQPNDGSGDDLRTAFSKVNQNFSSIVGGINQVSVANIGMTGYVDNAVSTANIGMTGYVDNAVSTANVSMTGYVDNAVSTANVSMTGYVNSIAFGNIDFAGIVSTANIGMKGYVDQGNTIQAAAITSANIGMKGYVDSIAYNDSDVDEYLASGNISNIAVINNISTQTVNASQGTFGNIAVTGNIIAQEGIFNSGVSIFGNIRFARVNGYRIGYRDIPQLNFEDFDGILGTGERGHHVLTTSSTISNIYIPDSAEINWPLGSTVMVINHGTGNANIIANAGVSLYLAGSSDTGANARIVLSRGVATLTNISANVWYIYGTSIV
jgi:hypothetical protein